MLVLSLRPWANTTKLGQYKISRLVALYYARADRDPDTEIYSINPIFLGQEGQSKQCRPWSH